MANTKITTNVIADDAITTAKIADDAVGNDQLASGLTLGGNTAATLSTAAQPNITSLGTLSALTISGDLTVDTSTLKVDSSNNRVGVGTASPAYALDVDSTIHIGNDGSTGYSHSRLIFDSNGSVRAAGNFFHNQANDVEWFAGNVYNLADSFSITRNATASHADATADVTNSLFTIRNDGKVGIGTTAPGSQLQIYNAAAGALPLLRTMSHATAAGSFSGDYSVEFRHATSTVTHAMLVTNVEANNARRTLDVADSNGIFASFVNGKVGIGTLTPSTKLNVVSTGSATYSGSSAGSNIALQLTNAESGAAGRTIGIAFSSESNAEVYLNCVTESGNNGGDFVVASRNGGSRAEKIRVHAGGDLSIANGNLVVSAAGAGIDFSATTNAGFGNTSGTVNSEVLDDYEEGSWNPQIVAGTTNPNGSNLSPDGHYIRIGRQVFVSFYVGVNWSNNPAGGIYVQGLPFNIANSSDNVAHIPCITYNFQIGNTEVPFLATQINDQTLRLYMMSSGAWGAANFASHVATPLYISGQVTYFAA